MLIVAICVLIAAAIAIGAYAFLRDDPKAEFHKFLRAQSASNEIALKARFSNEHASIDMEYFFNSDKRNIMIKRSVTCNSVYNSNPIQLSASVYSINGKQYIRLDNIQGKVISQGVPTRDLTLVFKQAKGVWYEVPEVEPLIYYTQKYGALIMDSGIIDSNIRPEKLSDGLTSSGAMELINSHKKSDGWTFEIINHRKGWAEVLNKFYGNDGLAAQNQLVLFGPKDQKKLVISGATSNGNYKFLTTTNRNYCKDLFKAFTSLEPKDQTDEVAGEARPVSSGTMSPINITNPRPLMRLSQDLQL